MLAKWFCKFLTPSLDLPFVLLTAQSVWKGLFRAVWWRYNFCTPIYHKMMKRLLEALVWLVTLLSLCSSHILCWELVSLLCVLTPLTHGLVLFGRLCLSGTLFYTWFLSSLLLWHDRNWNICTLITSFIARVVQCLCLKIYSQKKENWSGTNTKEKLH